MAHTSVAFPVRDSVNRPYLLVTFSPRLLILAGSTPGVRNSVTHQGGCRVTQHRQEATLQRPPATRFDALYRTPLGQAVVARSEDYLATLPDDSIDLVLTSPPVALLREKA